MTTATTNNLGYTISYNKKSKAWECKLGKTKLYASTMKIAAYAFMFPQDKEIINAFRAAMGRV